MAWRKRRRYRLATIVSYLCAFFGIMFIVGNVIMLREGFVQLYATAFHERTPLPALVNSPQVEGMMYNKWRDTHLARVHELLPVELPASAVNGETQLRKLMENHINSGLKQKQPYMEAPRFPPRKINTDVPRHGRYPPPESSVIHVTSRDLRRSLHVTSDCSGLVNKTRMSVIGSGWTKLVYQTTYRGADVALKMVDPTGHDVSSCLEENKSRNWTYVQCYEQAVQKILKEIVLLRGLQHPHIVQVLGHCVPEQPYVGYHDNVVTMATELGESVDIIKLLHLSWEDRLRISYGLTKLLFYLAHSPYGSVILNDFRRQQFVLVKGELKLTDLDDMGFTETACSRDEDCQMYYSSVNLTLRTRCMNNQCSGLNEKKNIFNAARHFTTFLLPHGAPHSMRATLDTLVDHYSNATKSSHELLQDLTVIVGHFSSGSYLDKTDRRQTRYKKFPDSDMPGEHDYSCRYAVDGSGCAVSVHDQREAEDLCDREDMCRGFVLSGTKTWTGRTLVHLKNGFGHLQNNTKTTVFMKPGL